MKTQFVRNRDNQICLVLSPSDDVVISETGSPSRILVFEPISAATIAMWLAQGAVAYLGGKALSAILGDPDLSDVERWIRGAVEEIKVFIREELRRQFSEHALTEMKAGCDAVLASLTQYGRAPSNEQPTLLYLLQNADIETNKLMSLANLYLPSAIYVYCDAVSLRLMTHSCLFRLTQAVTNQNEVVATVASGKVQVSQFLQMTDESWRPDRRVSEMKYDHGINYVNDEFGFPMFSVPWWTSWCVKDGRRIDLGSHSGNGSDRLAIQAAERKFAKIIADAQQEHDEVFSDMTEIFANIAKHWEQASQSIQS